MNQTGAPALSFPGHSRIPIMGPGDWIRVRFGSFFKSNLTIAAKLNFRDSFQKKRFYPKTRKTNQTGSAGLPYAQAKGLFGSAGLPYAQAKGLFGSDGLPLRTTRRSPPPKGIVSLVF
jgi:hypothetical protein